VSDEDAEITCCKEANSNRMSFNVYRLVCIPSKKQQEAKVVGRTRVSSAGHSALSTTTVTSDATSFASLTMSAIDSAPVPPSLERAYARLLFPPSYVVVGAYRMMTDKNLYGPAWTKCRNGFIRGATVGFVWVSTSIRLSKMKEYLIRTVDMSDLPYSADDRGALLLKVSSDARMTYTHVRF
jgi:hypothetical protein